MQQQNDDFIDWDGIPDTNVVPTGDYLLHVEKIDDTISKNPVDGIPKRMFSCQYIIEEPIEMAGMHYFENLSTGSAEAPKGMVPGSMGTRAFKGMMKACNIPKANSIAQLVNNAVVSKAKLMMGITRFIQKGGDPQYEGQERNRTTGYYKIGERQPMIRDPQFTARQVTGVMVAPVAVPGIPEQVVGGPVYQAPPAQPAAVAPQAPAQPVVAAPLVGQPVGATVDVPQAPQVPAQPVAAVPQAQAPVTPVVPAAPQAVAQPIPQVPMIKCVVAGCNAVVPQTELAKHMQEVHVQGKQIPG